MVYLCSQIEMDDKYQGQTCGLCGNFDGIANDLMKDGNTFFSVMGITQYSSSFMFLVEKNKFHTVSIL